MHMRLKGLLVLQILMLLSQLLLLLLSHLRLLLLVISQQLGRLRLRQQPCTRALHTCCMRDQLTVPAGVSAGICRLLKQQVARPQPSMLLAVISSMHCNAAAAEQTCVQLLLRDLKLLLHVCQVLPELEAELSGCCSCQDVRQLLLCLLPQGPHGPALLVQADSCWCQVVLHPTVLQEFSCTQQYK